MSEANALENASGRKVGNWWGDSSRRCKVFDCWDVSLLDKASGKAIGFS